MSSSSRNLGIWLSAVVSWTFASSGCGDGASSTSGMGGAGAGSQADAGSTNATTTQTVGSGGAGGGSDIPPGPQKSIKDFTTCDGVTDDWDGASKAFAAAKGGAFILIVDCPVKIHLGSDIEHPIFVDNDTTVAFTGAGKFILDNLFVPGFVIANTSKVDFIDWNVEWDGSMPIDEKIGSYEKNGEVISDPGGNGSGHFNDLVLKPWLEQNRGIVFDQSQGYVSSQWQGSVNTGALFFIIGDSSNVTFKGMNVYAPPEAQGYQFIPFVFMLAENFKSNQTVTGKTPVTSQYRETPHDITFSNVSLDGTYMGFQGSTHDAVFEHIRSSRYGDLQDQNGANVGGLGKFFPPPHLFYLNYNSDPDASSLANKNIKISDVIDTGDRVGVARDTDPASLSGYALSLKLGCVSCSVDGYSTNRPDGFMDVLVSDGLTVSNVTATYSSTFINNLFPGWRWPISPYSNVSFSNVTLTDTAATTTKPPVGGANGTNIVFDNVKVELASFTGTNPLMPTISGQGANSQIEFDVAADASKGIVTGFQSVGFSLLATPATLTAGSATVLKWASTTASSCTASGAWSGTLPASGSKSVTLPNAGNQSFVLTCQNATDSATITLPVVVQ